MKVKNQEAISKEAERIFSVALKKIKVKPASFWNRLKWKILGAGSALLALRHDSEVFKELEAELHELTEDVERGYYYIEVVMDDAGINPLPCSLCHGEKKIVLRTEVAEFPFMSLFTPFVNHVSHDVYEECPICWGSGYQPALTKKLKELLKESKPLRECEHL